MSDNKDGQWPYLLMRFHLSWLLGLLVIPLGMVTLLWWCKLFESEDVLTITLIFGFVLLVFGALEAWKAYLGHLKSESDRIEERHEKLEAAEQARKKEIIAQDDKRRKEAKENEDNIKKIVTKLFNAKIEELEGYVAEKATRDELLRLANELKTTTEEYYDSDRKQTKVTTQSVPDDVREKILKAYPVSSYFKTRRTTNRWRSNSNNKRR